MGVPTLRVSKTNDDVETAMTENDFLLTTPTVYGFSLSDKLWREHSLSCEFIISDVSLYSGVQC